MHLSQLFQRTARLHGDRPALVWGARPSVSYAGLNKRVRALAGWLRNGLGLQPGARVTLAMKNCPQYIESMLAIWHAGLCAVPVNCKLHPNELDYVLRQSESSACLTLGDLHRSLHPVAADIPGLKLIDVGADEYRCALTTVGIEAIADDAGDTAWLFYTSGTTGQPKGVMLTHDNLVAMALNFFADVQSVEASDAIIHVAPLSHGSGLYSIPYWIHGALQIVPESGGFDEPELFDLLDRHQSVSLFAAPTMVRRMVSHAGTSGSIAGGLRTLLVGGAPFYVEDIKSAVGCFGPRIAQIYGQGESPMSITALSPRQIERAVADQDTGLLESVGTSLTSLDVAILDEEGCRLPAGTTGEVAVRGPTVMRGYWKDPQATSRALSGGWLRTGDVGVRDERGLLQLKDRSKDVIISGGSNIYPREVEQVLLKHPAVQEVSVVGRKDREWGEVVVAFVVGCGVSEQELDALCLEHIARFKRPKEYCFVDHLPKNNYGKVLKTELRTHGLIAGTA